MAARRRRHPPADPALVMALVLMEAGITAGDGDQLRGAAGVSARDRRTLRAVMAMVTGSGMELEGVRGRRRDRAPRSLRAETGVASDSGMEVEANRGRREATGMAAAPEAAAAVELTGEAGPMGLVTEVTAAATLLVVEALLVGAFSGLEAVHERRAGGMLFFLKS